MNYKYKRFKCRCFDHNSRGIQKEKKKVNERIFDYGNEIISNSMTDFLSLIS